MLSPRFGAALAAWLFLSWCSVNADDVLEKLVFKEKLPYRLLKPAEIEKDKKYPLVIFLHGAGERGNDNTAQLKHGVGDFASNENRKAYPCFLIAPQVPTGGKWVDMDFGATKQATPKEPNSTEKLTFELIDEIMKKEPVDPKRVYITGLSMGGYGTWDFISRKPDLFAAAAPICGGGDEANAEKIKKIPIWCFHGDKDPAVPVVRSRNMIAAIEKAGGKPKYTEYPGVGHDSWTATYKNPEFMKWLFSQTKE